MDFIYILNNSPYNEDFLLENYAIDEQGLKKIAHEYYNDIYGKKEDLKIKVDFENKTVEVWESNEDNFPIYSFHIHKMSIV